MGFSFGVDDSTLPKETPRDYAKLSEALHRPEALNLVRNQIPARSTPHYGPLCITPGATIVTPDDPQHGGISGSPLVIGASSISTINSMESLQ